MMDARIKVSNKLMETREDFLEQAQVLKTLAFHQFKNADMKRGWDSFTRQQSKSKNDIKRELIANLQFLDTLCVSAGFASILKEEEPVVIPELAGEQALCLLFSSYT